MAEADPEDPVSRPFLEYFNLRDAVKAGDISEVRKILRARRPELNLEESDDYSPLWLALLSFRLDIAELLVRAGANPNERCAEGMTQAQAASAKESEVEKPTPLHFLCKFSYLCCVKEANHLTKTLIQYGADPNLETLDCYGSNKPIYHSIYKGNYYQTATLLPLDTTPRTEQDWHFYASCCWNSAELMKLFPVESYPKQLDEDNRNLLHWLALNINEIDMDVVKSCVLVRQCNVNQVDDFDCSPLDYAIQNKKVELISYLIANGARMYTERKIPGELKEQIEELEKGAKSEPSIFKKINLSVWHHLRRRLNEARGNTHELCETSREHNLRMILDGGRYIHSANPGHERSEAEITVHDHLIKAEVRIDAMNRIRRNTCEKKRLEYDYPNFHLVIYDFFRGFVKNLQPWKRDTVVDSDDSD